MTKPSAPPLRSTRLAFALEPRMMFDGAAVPTGLAMADAAKPATLPTVDASAVAHLVDVSLGKAIATEPAKAASPTAAEKASLPGDVPGSAAPAIGPAAKPGEPAKPAAQLIVIDPSVDHADTLIAGLSDSGAKILILSADQDAISQISAGLAALGDVSALHIVSHGKDGAITLGGVTIDAAALEARAADFAAWGQSLGPDADLLLYGCRVAADGTGSAFIDRLAQLTGADVAGSDDATGGAAFGGDWILEHKTGQIEAQRAFTDAAEASYQGILAAPVAGGDVTAKTTTNVNVAITQDTTTATTIRITPTTLTDPDGGTVTGIRLISAIGGTVTTTGGAAITFGQNGTILALSGGSADLRFTPHPTANAAQLVYVVVDAQANTNPNSGQSVVSVPITPVNHAPSLDPSLTMRLDASFIDPASNNRGTLLSTLLSRNTDPRVGRIFDIDSGNQLGFAITGAAGTNGAWQYSTDDGASWTNMGSVSAANALLLESSSTRVRFDGTAAWSGAASLTVRAWDQTVGSASFSGSPSYADTSINGGNTAYSANTASIAANGIAVSGVGTRPIVFASGETNMNAGETTQLALPTVLLDSKVTTILSGATISFVAGSYNTVQDRLNFTNQSGISGNFNAANGVLTLSGNASVTAYQTALRSIVYSNALTNPIALQKVIQVSVTDNGGRVSDANSGFAILGPSKGGAAVAATNDTVIVNGGVSSTITSTTLLANDNAGTNAKIVSVGSATNGAATLDAVSGVVTFVPNAGFVGTATFTYKFAPNAVYDSSVGAVHNFVAVQPGGGATATGLSITGQSAGQQFSQYQVVRGANSGAIGLVVDRLTNSGGIQTDVFIRPISGFFWAGEALTPVDGTGVGTISAVTPGTYQIAEVTKLYGMGGWVANAATLSKSNFVAGLFGQANGNGAQFVGGADSQQEGVWTWSGPIGPGTLAGLQFWQGATGGTGYGYAAWNVGEPNDSGGQDGLVLNAYTNWDDAGLRVGARVVPIEFGGKLGDAADYPTVTVTVTVKSMPPTAASTTVSLAPTNALNVSPPGATALDLFGPVYQDPFYPITNGGVAITGNAASSSDGVWQYRSGSVWTNVPTTVSDTNALVIDETSEIRFLPATGVTSTPGALTVRLWDGTQSSVGTGRNLTGLIGGNGAFAADADRITLTTSVVATQSAPVATGASVTLASTGVSVISPPGETVAKLFNSVYSDAETPITQGGVALTGTTANPTTQGVWQYSSDGGSSWTNLTGLSQSTAFTLAATDQLRFLPVAGFSGAVPALTARLWDRSVGPLRSAVDTTTGSGGTGPYSSSEVSLATSVTTNTAPVASGSTVSLPAILRNATSPAGDTVQNLFSSAFGDSQQALSTGGGVAIVANDATTIEGTWQYSTDGGTVWTNLPTVAANSAFTLRSTDKIRFVPATDFFGSVGALKAVLWDRTSGKMNGLVDTSGSARGGSGAFSTAEVTVNETVTFVNTRPVVTGGPITLANSAINASPAVGVGIAVSAVYSDKDTPVDDGGVAITGNASNAATQGVWQYSTNNGGTWTPLPAVSAAAAFTLGANDLLRFRPNLYFVGAPGVLTAVAWDRSAGAKNSTVDTTGGSTTSAYSSGSFEIRITVNSNAAPVPTGPTVTATNVPQNNTTSIGQTVQQLFTPVWSDPAPNETAVWNGGIAVIGNAANAGTQGRWQYTTQLDGLGGWTNIPTTASTNAALTIAAAQRIRFIPLGAYVGTPGALTVVLWDRTALNLNVNNDITGVGAQGGVGSVSLATVSLGVTVGTNTSPVANVTTTALAAVNGGVTNPAGETVTNLFTTVYSDGQQALSGGGIAIIGNAATSSQGIWQYSINGISWSDVPTVGVTNAFLLSSSAKLRFVPGTYFSGTPGALTTALWDGTDGIANSGSFNITAKRGGVGAFSTGDVTLTTSVNPNNAPVAGGITTAVPTIAEDATAPIGSTVAALFSTLYSDVEQTMTNAGVVITDNAATAAQGKWQYSTNGGSSWNDLGAVSSTAAFTLASSDRLRFLPTADFNGTPGALTARLWDRTSGTVNSTVDSSVTGGTSAFSTGAIAVTETVTAVNDAPVAGGTSVTLAAILEDAVAPAGDTVSALFGSVYSDIDLPATTAGIAVTGNAATSAEGKWQYSINGGTSWTDLPVVSANSAFLLQSTDKLRFLPAANFNGNPGSLTTRLWDGSTGTAQGTANLFGGSSTGGTTAFSASNVSLATSVTAVNDAPTAPVTSVTLAAVAEDTANPPGSSVSTLFSTTFSDIDLPAPSVGVAVTANAATVGQGRWQYSINSGSSWADLPTVSNSAAFLLRSTDQLRFLPAANYNGTPGGLTVRMWDGTTGAAQASVDLSGVGATGGTTAFGATTVTLGTSITAVNDAPVETGTAVTLPAILEDATAPAGDTVSALFGSVYSDLDVPATMAGVAITGNAATAAEGKWQYSINGGSSWTTLPVVNATSAFLLRGSDVLRFLPAANFNGTPGSLTTRLWDGSTGAAQGIADLSGGSATGGATAFSTAVVTLETTVTPANDAPVPTSTSVSLAPVLEDATNPAGETVSSLFGSVSSDVDLPATNAGIAITDNASTIAEGTWQYSIDGGTSWTDLPPVAFNSAFILQSTDKLRFVPASEYFGIPGGLTVRLWDGSTGAAYDLADLSGVSGTGGQSAFSAATIALDTSVTAVNDAPVASVTSVTLAATPISLVPPSGATIQSLFGASFSDIDGSTFVGVAITANPTVTLANFKWEYSTDGGTSWQDVGSRIPANALLLGPTDRVRAVPNGLYAGPVDPLSVKLWDGTTGSAGASVDLADPAATGGTTAFSGADILLETAITNTAPTVVAASVVFPSIAVGATSPAGSLISDIFAASIADAEIPGFQGGVAIIGNGATVDQGIWQVSFDNGSSWSDLPAVSASNAKLLSTTDRLRFLPTSTYAGPVGALTAHLWDGVNPPSTGPLDLTAAGAVGGSAAFSVATVTLTTDVTNTKPVAVVTSAVLGSISLNTTNPAGATVVSLFAAAYSDGETPLANGGVAVTGNAALSSQGVWQYSIDGGTNWFGVGARSDFSAPILAASDRVRFVPVTGFAGPPGNLTTKLWDGVNATAHSVVDLSTPTTAFSDVSVALGTSVINTAPVATGGSVDLASVLQLETNPPGMVIGNLFQPVFSDADGTPLSDGGVAVVGSAAVPSQGKWQYSTTAGITWTDLSIVNPSQALLLGASDQVRFVPSGSFFGRPGSLTVRLWDGVGAAPQDVRDLSTSSTVGGTTSFSAATIDLGIDIGNLPPVASVSDVTLPAIAQGTTRPAGALVSTLFASAYSDVETPALGGIGVVGSAADGAIGVWQYSKDNGGSWTTFIGLSETTAVMLVPTDRIRFLPSPSFSGIPGSLTVRLWDGLAPPPRGTTLDLTGSTAVSTTVITVKTAINATATTTSTPTVTSRLIPDRATEVLLTRDGTLGSVQRLPIGSPVGQQATDRLVRIDADAGAASADFVVARAVGAGSNQPVDLGQPLGTPSAGRSAVIDTRTALTEPRNSGVIDQTAKPLPGLVGKNSPFERVERNPALSLVDGRLPTSRNAESSGSSDSVSALTAPSFTEQLRREQDRKAIEAESLDLLLAAFSQRKGQS